MLPDSNTSEPLSHGFVQYSIQSVVGLQDSTVINNTAYILFDINPPVVTNTAINTLVLNPPNQVENEPESARVEFHVWPTVISEGITEISFINTSRSGYIVSILDARGMVVQTVTTDGSSVRLPSSLSAGAYFLHFTNISTGESNACKIVVY